MLFSSSWSTETFYASVDVVEEEAKYINNYREEVKHRHFVDIVYFQWNSIAICTLIIAISVDRIWYSLSLSMWILSFTNIRWVSDCNDSFPLNIKLFSIQYSSDYRYITFGRTIILCSVNKVNSFAFRLCTLVSILLSLLSCGLWVTSNR